MAGSGRRGQSGAGIKDLSPKGRRAKSGLTKSADPEGASRQNSGAKAAPRSFGLTTCTERNLTA
jgi:hypothetical protein